MNRKGTTIFIFIILFSIALAFFCKLFIKESLKIVNEGQNVIYNELGNIEYKVFLKENDYYTEPYLGKNMKYIASLIDKIEIDFNYDLETSHILSYNYKYDITGNLIIADKNNSIKVLYEKPYTLLKETSNELESDMLTLNESIIIDYDKYNNQVNNFEKDYSIVGNSNLFITLDIFIEGEYSNNKFERNKKLNLTIPLSEQTIDITIDAEELESNGVILKNKAYKIVNIKSFVIGIISGITSLIALIVAFTLYFKKEKDVYKKTINKILKEYDRIIVNSNSINEADFDTIIEVNSFQELVNAHETTEEPILYVEVIENEKSHFIILKDKTLYKYTISKEEFL